MKREPIRLLVIDDHPLVHQGIAAIVAVHSDLELLGTARGVEDGLKLLAQGPDIALVDLRLAGESGLTLVAAGQETAPQCKFILMTSALDKNTVLQAMERQVAGYILKEATPDEMVRAIRLVAQGRPYMDPGVMELILAAQGPPGTGVEELTGRQHEVLQALGQGLGTEEIADALQVSASTVKKHISEILAKLGLADRTQAALYAVAHGIVQVEDINLRTVRT